MKFTEVQRCIIAVNIIGVLIEAYRGTETTAPIRNLKLKCEKFRDKQSGVELQRGLPVIVNAKRYNQYVEMNIVGDRVWQETIDHFAKQDLMIDAVSMIESVYLFNENVLTKHAKIKRSDLDAYRYENANRDYNSSIAGTAVGGHLMGLIMKEQGVEVNGKLRALKLEIVSRPSH